MDLETLKVIFILFGTLVGAAVTTGIGLWPLLRKLRANDANVESIMRTSDALRIELSNVQQELAEKTRASRERDDRIDTLTDQLRRQEILSREVERTNAMLQGRLSEQREIYGTQLLQQSGQIADLRVAVSTRDTKITELEQSSRSKEAALDSANETIARLETELRTEQQDHERRIAALEAQVRDMTAEREQIIKERDQAIARADELAASLAARDATIAELEAKLAVARTPVDARKAEGTTA